MKYDFFVAGRWRNKDGITPVVELIRANGRTAYCFLENSYEGEEIEFGMDDDPEEFMKKSESLPVDHPLMKKIFETDIEAERASNAFILVFPAGLAAHIEAGIAYGMGKKCYAIGTPEKTETLYQIFDEIFPDTESFTTWLVDNSH